MSSAAEAGPGVRVIGERPSIDAPELPAQPYEFARHRKFEIHVDEPAHLKGDDNHPQPLIYVAAGLGA